MSDKKPATAKQMHATIKRILATRSLAAAQSQYDAKVCVRAVGTASDLFLSVTVEGTAAEYGQSVLKALEPIYDNYNDSDGEFTSGKSSIGDVYFDIMGVIEN